MQTMQVNGTNPGSGVSWHATASGLERIHSAAPSFVTDYERQGFALVKSVFTLDEVLEMRRRCAEVFERTGGQIGDVASYPELREILLDERLVAVARAALGRPVYFGDSTFYANSRFDRHMHNDAHGDAEDPSCSTYGILRIGLYLQDHAFHSNGLKVGPGSHRTVFWNTRNALRLVNVGGKRLSLRAFKPTGYYNVPSEPGDLVFWNLRTHHAGHALRLRALDRLALPPLLEHYLPERLARPMPRDRFAIFSSWGRSSAELEAYIKQLGYSPHYRPYWERSTFDSPDARNAFAERGVDLRDDVLRLTRLGA